MTQFTLFGLALAPLYAAIAEIESHNGDYSANVYQIDEDGHGYVDDVNRILRERTSRDNHNHYSKKLLRQRVFFGPGDVYNKSQAEFMMGVYWSHWGAHYEVKTGNPVTYEVLARIHNGGPLGWKKPATLAYWAKVKAVMEGGAK